MDTKLRSLDQTELLQRRIYDLVKHFCQTSILLYMFGRALNTPPLYKKCKALYNSQKQPSIGVLGKRCYENMPQIYRRTPMQRNFIEIKHWHGRAPVN